MTRPYEPLSAAVLDELRGVSTATLTYYLYKRGLRNVFMQGVASLTRGETLVGQAFTLRFIPLREDKASPSVLADPSYPQRLAIETVEPGDVLVMDARGDTRAGTLGDILVARIRARGAAGVVTDGAVRDALAIAEQELPVYCGGAHAAAHVAVHMAVDLNLPVACGGVAVYPGDVIVGDREGVVVIPRAIAAEVAPAAAGQEEMERWILERVEAGASTPGLYPPNAETLAAYEAWRRSR